MADAAERIRETESPRADGADGSRARRRRSPMRRLRRRLRPLFTRPLLAVARVLGPPLYTSYMRFVWATSRIEPNDFPRLHGIIAEHDGAVGILWHEEVATVAWAYPYLGFRPATLASLSNAGDLITRLLERCGFITFRGGSSSRHSRRRTAIVHDMIDYMRSHERVIFGITVDGSEGPAYRVKPGALVIARECGRPVVLARTWCARAIRLRTWDRTAIPLPWNRIAYYLDGPYLPPEDAHTEEGFERFRRDVERRLVALAARSYDDLGQPRPPNLPDPAPPPA